MEHKFPAEKRIDFPGVNGCAICDCGCATFRVGIGGDAAGNNHIRCLECTFCGHKLAIPFFDTSLERSVMWIPIVTFNQENRHASIDL